MDSSINDRVAELIKALGLNENSFSVRIGVASPVIHNIVKGRRNKPSFDVLQKIILAFNNINVRWLILGEGKILASAHPNAHLSAHLNEDASKKILELEQENMVLKAQIEALYKAFEKFGAGNGKQSRKGSRSA